MPANGRIATVATASLILGIIGTVTGVGALVWQVITWTLSGPVISVSANQGFRTYGDQLGDQITIVTATNSGRSPVTVRSWGLRFPDGHTMIFREPFSGSATLPHRLEGGASA